jgi:hypothetical protein
LEVTHLQNLYREEGRKEEHEHIGSFLVEKFLLPPLLL